MSLVPYPVDHTKSFDEILPQIYRIPSEAIFLGMGIDGLPVLLNMNDSLNVLFLERPCDFDMVEEAKAFFGGIHMDLVRVTKQDLWEEAGWQTALALGAYLRGTSARVLLMIESWEDVENQDFDCRQNFRWLLNHPRCTVIANANAMPEGAWAACFQSKIRPYREFFAMPEGEGTCYFYQPKIGG